MRRNFISALPRKCAAFFLESPAPCGDVRSRVADGRFQRPNPHRHAGSPPAHWGGAGGPPAPPPSPFATPAPPHRQRPTPPQSLGNLAQRPATARQQPHRLPLEFIRELTTRCTHQTPSCPIRSLSEVSIISREGHDLRADQSANGADHSENASDIGLIESMDGNACADECCRDLRLEIREGEDEVGLERGIFGIWAEVKAEKVKRFDR